jgi:hypothetical protein
MGGEAVFTTKRIEIPCPDSSVPQVTISALSDLHRGVKGHSGSRLADTLAYVKKRMAKDPHHYSFFLGDQNDKMSDSERKGYFSAALHAGTVESIDEWMVTQDLEPLAKDLAFMGERNLGFIGGNHSFVFQTHSEEYGYAPGMTAEQWLAKRLNTHWLGWLCYMRLTVKRARNKGEVETSGVPLDLVLCHGKGGGKLAGSTINGVDDLRRIFPSAHMYFMGHDHQMGVVPASMLEVANGPSALTGFTGTGAKAHLKVRQHDQLLCRCGSFLKGYEPGQASYVVRALLRPSCLGNVEVKAKLLRKRLADNTRSLEWRLEGTVKPGGSRAVREQEETEE